MRRIDRLRRKYLKNEVIEIEDLSEVEMEIYGYYDDENGVRHYKRTAGDEDSGGEECGGEHGGPI